MSKVSDLHSHVLSLLYSIWYTTTGVASIVSPVINYGWGQIGDPAHSWRYMYYWAGAITIAWGIALWWVLPGEPVTVRGYTDRERYIMIARIRSNNTGVRNTHFKMAHIVELAIDPRFWLTFSIALLSMITNGPVSSFLPIIINGFGYSTFQTLLMFMPAGAVVGTFQFFIPLLASKIPNSRCWLIAGTELITIISAILLWRLPLSQRPALLYACYSLSVYGSGYAVMMGLTIANTAGYTKRTATSAGLYIGYCIGNLLFESAPEAC